MIIIGIVLLGVGLLVSLFAFRGRVAARGQFCKKCRFDLAGLEIEADGARCPECGSEVSLESARRGLIRRRSRVGLGAAVLLMLAGGGGIWAGATGKTGSIITAMPDPIVLWLTDWGVDEALDELVVRVSKVPGTMSAGSWDDAIEQGLAFQADTALVWDERWGEVLVIAMLEKRLVGDALYKFVESSLIAEFETRQVIRDEDQMVYYRLIVKGNPWGASAAIPFLRTPKSRVLNKWMKSHGTKSPFQINIEFERDWIDKPFPIQLGSGQVWLREWAPVAENYVDFRKWITIPTDSQDQTTLHSRADFTLLVDGQEVHAWSSPLEKTVQRSAEEIEYAQAISDKNLIDQFVEGLSVGYVQLPTKRSLGRTHFGTRDSNNARTIRVHYRGEVFPAGIAMLFDASVAIDGIEVEYAGLYVDTPNALNFKRGSRQDRNMLDYFDQHEEFWQRALERGSVDLILRPNSEYAKYDPRFTARLDAKVIFRNVPLMVLVPEDTGDIWKKTGEPEWRWVQERQQSYSSTFAEILIEGDDEE